ncbi:ferric-dicitrate binding protein FerR (iron transport regulator) [Chitinophaga terrae (ex Kim and Jung 2007)]|uniref:FecR family protein n=1 Tax=Chitinophaga terrae (ex Kim and Jung 2007) TaxID=408074 RepID=UPI002786D439|nr:FecR domain-containing protein [Chitinophaga terrae (ex Kim and Jung 2007)]MDQ0110468.1 ferric-dicitrate binding protein FerR (iron transport regulator) [Chitinophaga terrae (ex Kim and Jung 2007)]
MSRADQPPPVRRVRFLEKWGWAAAVLILLGAGTYLYMATKKKDIDLVKGKTIATPGILPGSNKALLTLSDGTTITLDSAASGAIAQQGSSSIIKTPGGEIVYNAKGLPGGEVMMNTMSTPRGGQYRLTLPDGTTVWLNAASSITFPAAFTGNDRKVKVTGEVYMEVVKNDKMPFRVDVDGRTTVEVLGTSFNINSYTDEGAIVTTLIEGKVRVLPGNTAVSASAERQSATLRPGQQAFQPNNTTTVNISNNANMEQVLAWKNGIFSFTGKSFPSAMKDIERWYDIQVSYEGAIPTIKLKGEMDRGVQLTDLIRFLQGYQDDKLGVNIVYNKSGRKTYFVTNSPSNTEYEQPREQLDAQISYRFLKARLEVKINGGNLLNAASVFYNNRGSYEVNPDFQGGTLDFSDAQRLKPGFTDNYEEGDLYTFKQRFGRTYSASLTYTF